MKTMKINKVVNRRRVQSFLRLHNKQWCRKCELISSALNLFCLPEMFGSGQGNNGTIVYILYIYIWKRHKSVQEASHLHLNSDRKCKNQKQSWMWQCRCTFAGFYTELLWHHEEEISLMYSRSAEQSDVTRLVMGNLLYGTPLLRQATAVLHRDFPWCRAWTTLHLTEMALWCLLLEEDNGQGTVEHLWGSSHNTCVCELVLF